jgi:hypothetical protein
MRSASALRARAAESLREICPFIFGLLVWVGLFLRERRLRALISFTKSADIGLSVAPCRFSRR